MGSSNGTFDFGYLRVEDATARFDAPLLGPGGHLVVRPATPQNREYWSAMMAKAAGRRRLADAVRDDVEQDNQQQDRADDVEVFARHVVVSGLARAADGSMVRIDAGNVGDLLQAVLAAAPWLIDRLRAFCFKFENFVRLPAPPQVEPAELAKN